MIEWTIAPGMRCDVVMYAATNLTGKRAVMQSFPGGNRKGGRVEPADVRSMVIRAPFGTRITLRASAGPLWEELPHRVVRITEAHHVPPQRHPGLPGVRIPDLDRLDRHDAKRTERDLVSTYPNADHEGAWTFGRAGALGGKVRAIHIEREDDAGGAKIHPVEAVARAILAAVPPEARGPALVAAREALVAALREAGEREAEARADALVAELSAP